MADTSTPAAERAKVITFKIQAGILPQTLPRRAWKGGGSERICPACDAPIDASQSELEAELPSGHSVPFHEECFTAWWKALDARERAERP
jgi:hypothetical protein